MYRVSIELYKHEWKFGRTRSAVGTRAAGECLYSSIETRSTFFSISFRKQRDEKMENNLLTFIIEI